MTMHKYKIGQICKIVPVAASTVSERLHRYFNTECQITALSQEGFFMSTSLYGPAYGVQSLQDGYAFYACEATLQPRDQELGSWKELEKWYKPPTHRLANAIMEMNPLLRSL